MGSRRLSIPASLSSTRRHTVRLPWSSELSDDVVTNNILANFIQFLGALNVKTDMSEMTFGISRDAGAFEWSGTSLGALFAQSSNALRPSFWRMIFDIVRFNQFALDLLSIPPGSAAATKANGESIGQYLERNGYSDAFRDDYLIPMTACVWSTGADKCALEFPALTLVRFMWNHHLLTTVSERPPWLTVHGGSKNYIDAVMRECRDGNSTLARPWTHCNAKTAVCASPSAVLFPQKRYLTASSSRATAIKLAPFSDPPPVSRKAIY
jgi:predicted NAD/FAD-binding protein